MAEDTIDRVVDCAEVGESWKEFLRSRPAFSADIVIATEPKLRNALLAKRIPHRKFISPAMNFMLSDVKPAGVHRPKSVVDRLQQLFELALGTPIKQIPEVTLNETLLAEAASVLPLESLYVGLSPGAGGKSKQWPLQKFISTALE